MNVDDDRRTVRADAGPTGPPLLRTRRLVERDEVGRLVVLVAVKDDGVLVQDRRAAEAVLGVELSRRFLPNELAVVVVAAADEGGLVVESDPDQLAVGRRRGTGVAVELMDELLNL